MSDSTLRRRPDTQPVSPQAAGNERPPRVWRMPGDWIQYLRSVALVVAATLVGLPIYGLIAATNLVMVYLAAVLIAAVYLGRGPSILASLLSVLAFNFFFTEPRLTFVVHDPQYLLTFLGLLVVGLVISALAARVREQARAALEREAQTLALYALSRDLAAAGDLDGIAQAVIRHIAETFGREAVILLPEGAERRELVQRTPSPDSARGGAEQAAAAWAFEHGRPAGGGTDSLPTAGVYYLPLQTARGAVGVLGVRPRDPDQPLTPAQRELLAAFAAQTALAIERAQLSEAARQAEMLQATERLQTALLNSISHDLRTPLVSITGALSSLQEDEPELDPATRRSLVDNAREEVERLNRLVGNLLDMTRLAAGALHLRPVPGDVQDLAGSALAQLGERLRERPVSVTIPDDLPLVPMDDALMVQVLVNLLDNALKYSPAGSPIDITARRLGDSVELAVADRGAGIPPDDLRRVFDKFYRVRRTSSLLASSRLSDSARSGTGLGLSICQGIVEAHGGRIWAETRPGGGSVLRLALPIAPAIAAHDPANRPLEPA
jgi:two-component system sensor histidine kinase KdpD